MTATLDTRIPLSRIQQFEDITPNMKRSIIISHQKLPKDFFSSKHSVKRQLCISNPRGNLLSQKIPRNQSNYENTPTSFKRQAMTARQNRSNRDQDLMLGIISTSNEIKRVIRKHSMQLRRKEIQSVNVSPQKYFNRNGQKLIELPPLLMKKVLSIGL